MPLTGRTESVVAVDLGGTNMRCAIVDADGDLHARIQRPTPHDEPCTVALVDLVGRVRDSVDDPPGIIVMGVPGRVDYETRSLVSGPNLPAGWVDELAAAPLADQLGAEVHLANDADLAAVGEVAFGAAQGHRNVAYVTISTGVGGGVVLDGKLARSRWSLAEVGHTVVSLERWRAGLDPTVEGIGAGPAIALAAAEAGLPGDAKRISEMVRAGDPAATAVWDDALRASGAGIVNVVHLFGPDVVVVGGGVGLNDDIVLDRLGRILDEIGPAEIIGRVALVRAALGDDAALSGGAAWRAAFG
ncbi:MAG: ROK family protein [Acidimicrobiales bacterium]